jgi:hypothetical protein
MGSAHWVQHPTVPIDAIDLMICMDLVGHAVGQDGYPAEVRQTLFALGGERSLGTGGHLDRIGGVEPGVVVRRLDAEVIPPMSDYEPFWRNGVPFVFLTSGRWAHYHTPQDTPDKLDFEKISATARWLERFVRETCARPEPRIDFTDARDDAATLRSLIAITHALEGISPEAAIGRDLAEGLLRRHESPAGLTADERVQVQGLVMMLEQRLQ